MLELEIKHDINKNYLIVHGKQEGDYMVQMLDGNKIKGFLNMEVREMNNQREYYYDITGKETISQKTAREKWKYAEIVKLMAEILETVGKAREYLLSAEHFLLEPEYIYRDIASGKVFLCYVWSQSKNINEQFTQLFSYFLNVVDYEDQQAVHLVYKFYDVSREEQCTLQHLWSVFDTVSSEIIRKEDEVKRKELKTKETLESEGRKSKLAKRALWTGRNDSKEIVVGVEKKKKGKVRKLKPERERVSFLEKLHKSLEKLSSETEGRDTKGKEISKKGKEVVVPAKKQSISFQKDDSIEIPLSNRESTQFIERDQTVCFLSAQKEEQKVYHCHLLPEDENQSTISMGEFPFYIGRFQKNTNALKEIVSISRIHCKIEQLEGKYYVSDLHSTNGTYVNQKKLTEGNKRELKAGDELAIADIKYRFSL